jgi:hypothetical protein
LPSACDEPRPLAEAVLDLLQGVPPLHSLQLYLSNGCNLKCRHCWVNSKYLSGEPGPVDLIDVGLFSSCRKISSINLSLDKWCEDADHIRKKQARKSHGGRRKYEHL